MEAVKRESLWERFLKSKPLYSSNEEALKAYTLELEALAKSVNKMPYELLDEAEQATVWNEVHRKAKSLALHINSLKSLT